MRCPELAVQITPGYDSISQEKYCDGEYIQDKYSARFFMHEDKSNEFLLYLDEDGNHIVKAEKYSGYYDGQYDVVGFDQVWEELLSPDF